MSSRRISFTELIENRLKELERQKLRRYLSTPSEVDASANCEDFASNDYLGLGKAALHVSRETPIGSGASRLVTSNSSNAAHLEQAFAKHTGREAALLFTSGYAANVGTLSAILDEQIQVFSAEENHASLIDGIRLGKNHGVTRYPAHDLQTLARLLRESNVAKRLIVTEAVFSMDGSVINIGALTELARAHGAWLMIDEAHSYGLYGNQGAGLCAQVGAKPEILIAPLGKALGSQGAFVAGNASTIDYLSQRARSFVFSTGVSPLLAEASLLQLERCQRADDLRNAAFESASVLRQSISPIAKHHALELRFGDSLITSIILRCPSTTISVGHFLRQRGYLVGAIRPPTVERGTSRLRLVSRAQHTQAVIENFAIVLSEALSRHLETTPNTST